MRSFRNKNRLVGAFWLLLGASCATPSVERSPDSVSRPGEWDIREGSVFRGRDELNNACRLEILDIDSRGEDSRVRVQVSFGTRNVLRLWLSYPKTFVIGNESEADRSVLRTTDSAAPGELKVYLSHSQRPNFLVFWSRRNPQGETVRRICDHLVEVGQRRRPSNFGRAEAI